MPAAVLKNSQFDTLIALKTENEPVVLTAPVEREEIHTRRLEMTSYRRADGLYDIEGHLTDVKPFPHQFNDEYREPGEPVHDLWIRLTVDDDFTVVDSEAGMARGAYAFCQAVTPNFRNLIGLKIGRGWNKAVRERVGGVKGCTHIVEMLAQIATAAFQALWTEQARRSQQTRFQTEDDKPPTVAGSCYSWRLDGPAIGRYYPNAYKGPRDAEGTPTPEGPGFDYVPEEPEAETA